MMKSPAMNTIVPLVFMRLADGTTPKCQVTVNQRAEDTIQDSPSRVKDPNELTFEMLPIDSFMVFYPVSGLDGVDEHLGVCFGHGVSGPLKDDALAKITTMGGLFSYSSGLAVKLNRSILVMRITTAGPKQVPTHEKEIMKDGAAVQVIQGDWSSLYTARFDNYATDGSVYVVFFYADDDSKARMRIKTMPRPKLIARQVFETMREKAIVSACSASGLFYLGVH